MQDLLAFPHFLPLLLASIPVEFMRVLGYMLTLRLPPQLRPPKQKAA